MVSDSSVAQSIAADKIWDTLDAETQQQVVQLLGVLLGEALMVWRTTEPKGLHNHDGHQDQLQTFEA